jgi:UDP-glucose 4-epimerase
VLVTGGAGFIGHHLVAALVREQHDVRVLDNLRRGSFERSELAGARLIAGDVRSPDDCAHTVAGVDIVYHLAAQSNVMGAAADSDYTFEANVRGSWVLARAAERAGVGHFVFASSREVYGEPLALPVLESAPLAPKNAYGASKLAAETVLRAIDIPLTVVRMANVAGAGDSGRVLPLWIDAARHGQPLVLYGGDQVLDFVSTATVVRALLAVAKHGPIGCAINIGSGRGTALEELAGRIAAEFGVEIDRQTARAVEVRRFVAGTSRMREMGVTPFDDELGEALRCIRA